MTRRYDVYAKKINPYFFPTEITMMASSTDKGVKICAYTSHCVLENSVYAMFVCVCVSKT